VKVAGVALLLSLAVQDVILLSQHTHMPRNLSAGEAVRPFAPLEQEPFTRSLLLPEWLSRLLLRFDFHELHHMYVRVPGYDLHRIGYRPANEVGWLEWLRGAKRLTGTQFLFGQREDTGFKL
jgi:fatty acid desaturase